MEEAELCPEESARARTRVVCRYHEVQRGAMRRRPPGSLHPSRFSPDETCPHSGEGVGDRLRQQDVADQGVRLRRFAGVHVGLAREAGAVDHERRTRLPQQSKMHAEPPVIRRCPREVAERKTTARQLALERFTDISGATEQ